MRTRSATRASQQANGDQAAIARSLYSDLMVAFAGSAAQQLAGYADNTDGEHDSDFNNMSNYAAKLARIEAGLPMMPGPDEPQFLDPGDSLHTAGCAIIERAWTETVAMLEDNWQAVRVAGVIAKRDRLSQAELDHVIAHGQREAK